MSHIPAELDLATSIRPGLDILGNEIIIAFKKRSRFAQNSVIYQPGLVLGRPKVSLLDYELNKIERAHAELGRYIFASQEAFTDVSGVDLIIDRRAPESPIKPMASGVGPRLVNFYRLWIADACRAGNEPDTYGETVTADIAALLAVMERVNLGKFVAESKYLEAPERFQETRGEREPMLELLVRRDRETEVFELARRLAEHYDFDPDQAARLFDFMIATTIDIEVDYIRKRLSESARA